MKKILVLLFIFTTGVSYSQIKLSPQAEIRIVTVGPYQGELYSAFGHSGIRVYDPVLSIDHFYNWGVFDFDQPYFYLNFARGFLRYRLAVIDYPRVANFYVRQNRYVHEQVLNLDSAQLQQLHDFLQWNAQPENMYYYYDYFYDNCATRVRDAVEKLFADSVYFDNSYITTDYSIRDLTDLYLTWQPWGDLGIDICLGLPMDIKATPYMYMFLPDYIESAFDNAYITRNGKKDPLVRETIVTYEARQQESRASLPGPVTAFGLLLLAGALITWLGYKKGDSFFWFDAVLFSAVGLIGWLLLLLWTATDHNAASKNMNLLWAVPLHFPMGLALLSKKWNLLKVRYFTFVVALQCMVILLWFLWPQDLHEALIPVSLLLLLRSFYIRYYLIHKSEFSTEHSLLRKTG